MALNTADRKIASKELGRLMYVVPNKAASMTWDDLTAAIGSIDDTMNALPSALTAGQTIKQNINQRLTEPFKTAATIEEKAHALTCWAAKESGLI